MKCELNGCKSDAVVCANGAIVNEDDDEEEECETDYIAFNMVEQ